MSSKKQTPSAQQLGAHSHAHNKKIQARVRRIQGQLNAVNSSLENGDTCTKILQTLAAAKGAMNGLMLEIIEEHIQNHVVDPQKTNADSKEGAQELIGVLRSYLK